MTKRMIAAMLAAALVLGLTACGLKRKKNNSKTEHPSLDISLAGQENPLAFDPQSSPELTLSEAGAAAVLEVVYSQQAQYPYAGLYALEEVNRRLDFDAGVEHHAHNVRTDAGELDVAHMAALVQENNASYLESHTYGYETVEADYILELCGFLLDVVQAMQIKYPDLDWGRIYCNLGDLKILYRTGTLAYAQVNQDRVLILSPTNAKIVTTMEGEDGFARVLVHETMHLLQLGCGCEQIENCGRRAGISVYWDDFTLNTTDWVWMVEGSAERNMCALTGGEAVSYQYKMDYLCSYTMALLLRPQVQADTMDTLCFYDDPQLLFQAFGCESQQEQDEVLKLMITTNVLQSQPDSFFQAYKAAYGTDPRDTEESLDAFSYSLKPDICITLAKTFYKNLVSFLTEAPASCNDVFFLLSLFEAHLNQHLRYADTDRLAVNQPFLDSYRAMRDALLQILAAENPDVDVMALYGKYSILGEDQLLNAGLSRLPEEKREFLARRAQWLLDLRALSQTVPGE